MSYRDDQIRFLELVCSHMLPADFCDDIQEITVFEDELKEEGFSYNESINLLKEMYDVFPKINFNNSSDGKRGILINANNNVHSFLFDLKYPNADIENEMEEYKRDSIFTETPKKVFITIDSKKGIYRNDIERYQYPLGNTTQRMKIVKYLFTHERGNLKDLIKQTGQTNSVISQEIKRINISFRGKLHLSHDFITHLDTGGYCLNKEKFEIKENI